jgi:hypothetical protein
MTAVTLAITQPANGTVFFQGETQVRLAGQIVPTIPSELAGVPLHYRWYSSLFPSAEDRYSINEAALSNPATPFDAPLGLGSHVISLAASDRPGETASDQNATNHGGVTGGAKGAGQCIIHLLRAVMVKPVAAGPPLSKASSTLEAEAPLQWGREIGTTDTFEPNPDYHYPEEQPDEFSVHEDGLLRTTDKIAELVGVWPREADPATAAALVTEDTAPDLPFGADERTITLALVNRPSGELRIRYLHRSAAERSRINRLRYRWLFDPTPADGRASAVLEPAVSALTFDPDPPPPPGPPPPDPPPPLVRYEGPLPAALGLGSYKLTLRVQDIENDAVGHQVSLPVTITA